MRRGATKNKKHKIKIKTKKVEIEKEDGGRTEVGRGKEEEVMTGDKGEKVITDEDEKKVDVYGDEDKEWKTGDEGIGRLERYEDKDEEVMIVEIMMGDKGEEVRTGEDEESEE